MAIILQVQAKFVANKNGIVTLELPSKEVDPQFAQEVERLLPYLSEAFYTALDKEVLLASVLTPTQFAAATTLAQ